MRVIAGLAKGHKLFAPNTHQVRPASDKVKGAIFNILGDINELKVLDLFAGSGSVGIEALSRGAKFCTFVEQDRKVAEFIHRNLAHCKFEEVSQVLLAPVSKGIDRLSRNKQVFDLVFVDPPYDKNLVNPTLGLLAESSLLSPEATIVVEHSPRELPISPVSSRGESKEILEIFDERRYGQTFISFLKGRVS